MWHVYILVSEKDKRTYTGSTNDLIRRVIQHNNGEVTSTKHRRPLKLLLTEACVGEKEARDKERYYKTAAGRRKLKEIIENIM